MNLTKSLKWAMIAAGVTAFSASAIPWVAEDFTCSGLAFGDKILLVGAPWSKASIGDGGDESKIAAADAARLTFNECPTPLESSNGRVLELNTEGDTLILDVTEAGAVDFSTDPVYVDMMVKFVLSEDQPTGIDDSCRTALYVDAASSNLWVFSGDGYGAFGWSEMDCGNSIDPELWYRLTLTWTFDWDPLATFTVRLNGEEVTGSVGIDVGTMLPGGSLYIAADISNDYPTQLKAIEFQGTGFIDELVVTDENPFDEALDLFASTYNVNAARLDAWRTAYLNGQPDETVGMYNAFLLNVEPDDGFTDAQLKILAIEMDGENAVIAIGAIDGAGATVQYVNISVDNVNYTVPKPNGTLWLQRAQTLGSWDAPFKVNLSSPPAGITVDPDGTVTVNMTGGYKFIKAKIE